jgi:ethanolaminephosphotransferase
MRANRLLRTQVLRCFGFLIDKFNSQSAVSSLPFFPCVSDIHRFTLHRFTDNTIRAFILHGIDSTMTAANTTIDGNQHDVPESNDFYYLHPDAVAHLKRFQYQGEDQSLLYKYVLSPLATFCINHLTPTWLAPNVITLIGLLWMISSYLIFWYYAPLVTFSEEKSEPPRWIFFFNGIAMLVYQTLDNMDGKQARRTHSSSPMGLLFDHGCDAVNMLFGSVNWMICCALHPKEDALLCWSILILNYTLFFSGTWEEYYTGKLVMPIFNGPSEGVVGGAFMSFTSGLWGPRYWQSHSWWKHFVHPVVTKVIPASVIQKITPGEGLRNADILILLSCIGFLQEMMIKFVTVSRKYGRHTLFRLTPAVILLSCSMLIDREVWWSMPRTVLHLFSMLYVEAITALMLDHMTQQPYRYMRWPLLPLVVLTGLHQLGLLHAGPFMDSCLLMYTTAVITYVVFKSAILVHECSTALNIWCFDICTPRTSTAAANEVAKKQQ